MSTITPDEANKILATVMSMRLSPGIGTKENACSLAAINLALIGKLTDEIPECMSLVVGRWIIKTQDYMPDKMRNSKEWKELLPLAAGTGRENHLKELVIIMDYMWSALTLVLPLARKLGFDKKWQTMLKLKTSAAADAAADAATALADDAALADAAADAAAEAAEAAKEDAAADAAVNYAAAAAADAAYASNDVAWTKTNPIDTLKKLVSIQ